MSPGDLYHHPHLVVSSPLLSSTQGGSQVPAINGGNPSSGPEGKGKGEELLSHVLSGNLLLKKV